MPLAQHGVTLVSIWTRPGIVRAVEVGQRERLARRRRADPIVVPSVSLTRSVPVRVTLTRPTIPVSVSLAVAQGRRT